METKELIKQAEINRRRLIEVVYNAKAGHIGGDLSCLNVMTALYFDIMTVSFSVKDIAWKHSMSPLRQRDS